MFPPLPASICITADRWWGEMHPPKDNIYRIPPSRLLSICIWQDEYCPPLKAAGHYMNVVSWSQRGVVCITSRFDSLHFSNDSVSIFTIFMYCVLHASTCLWNMTFVSCHMSWSQAMDMSATSEEREVFILTYLWYDINWWNEIQKIPACFQTNRK